MGRQNDGKKAKRDPQQHTDKYRLRETRQNVLDDEKEG